MKVTRQQLLNLINETVRKVLNESAYEKMLGLTNSSSDKGTSAGFLKVDDQHKEAAIMHFGGQRYGGSDKVTGEYVLGKNVMQSIAKATSKDLTRKNYYVWTGLDRFWDSGMTELQGVLGRKGDTYLYQGVGNKNSDGYYDKLQVVAGPLAKQMGYIFSNKKKIQIPPENDILGGIAASSSASSKSSSDSSAKSSTASSNSFGL